MSAAMTRGASPRGSAVAGKYVPWTDADVDGLIRLHGTLKIRRRTPERTVRGMKNGLVEVTPAEHRPFDCEMEPGWVAIPPSGDAVSLIDCLALLRWFEWWDQWNQEWKPCGHLKATDA